VAKFRDPVCGEEVEQTKYRLEFNGKYVYFCSPMCMVEFKKKPQRYTKNFS